MNELQIILQQGEGYKIEFKEKLAHLDREIVAFANAAGGSVYLGVDDAGKVVGIDICNKLKSQVTDIAHNCDPSIKVELISYGNVLEVRVAEGGDKPYRCKDGFFLRMGPNSQKLRRDDIVVLITNSSKIQFDETLNPKFSFPGDFSQQSYHEFLNLCDIQTKLPAQDVLQSLSVAHKDASKLVLNNTGILFFAKEPQKLYPEGYITAVRYKSQDRFSIIDKQDYKGSLIQQIEQALTFIQRHTAVAINVVAQSPVHEEIHEYPLVALREAVINAVVHRDYNYDGSHIYIHIYPDKIEIENPGGLYHGLTIASLGQRSVRRNRLIADLLHRAGYIERVGSGFDRMRQALQQNNNPPLEVSATNFFNIRFYKKLATDKLSALTQRQQRLYQFVEQRKTITIGEAAMALGCSNDTALRELNVLLQQDLLTKLGRGKATSYILLKKDT